MAKGKTPLKPPTAAGGRGPAGKKHRPAWHRLLQWAKANPGATLAAALSVAFVVVISVWAPLTPNQFARVRVWAFGARRWDGHGRHGDGTGKFKIMRSIDQWIDRPSIVRKRRVLTTSPTHPSTHPNPIQRWYENGGAITHCNKALAIAKGRSELRCWQKTALPDGSVNRGQSFERPGGGGAWAGGLRAVY